MTIFKNRQSAGVLLAERLHKYKGRKDAAVLGILRGGIVVAAEVAKLLKLPLDAVITRKISDPHQKELALGAVDPEGYVVWNEDLIKESHTPATQARLTIGDLQPEVEKQREEILRREKLYRHARPSLEVQNKVIILVDDGIATGETMFSAVKYLKRLGAKKVVVTVPVGAQDAISKIASEGAENVVLFPIPPEDFQPVGSYYENFAEVKDQEVVQLLS